MKLTPGEGSVSNEESELIDACVSYVFIQYFTPWFNTQAQISFGKTSILI